MTLRKIAITLYAASVLALFSSPLAADTEFHRLAVFDKWAVNLLVDEEGDLSCSAGTRNKLGEAFDIAIYPDSEIIVRYWFKDSTLNEVDRPVTVEIEKPGQDTHWNISEMYMTDVGGYFFFDSPVKGMQFILDVQNGVSLKMPTAIDHDVSGQFALTGSYDAIEELFACFTRIQGIGA